jgi:type III restriction enzyme
LILALKSFQAEAVDELLQELASARQEARRRPQAVGLSSPTGSGKTVIATAVIESLFLGSDLISPDPDAIFLWITDQPELNEQTRLKMTSSSSLKTSQLVVIDSAFDEVTFPAGGVYLLNTQKLGKRSTYVATGDHRSYSLWETITNTIGQTPDHFFVVIDEAHRGMQETADREEANTIIQKFIKGSDEIPPAPIVLGISATIERFDEVLAGTERVRRPVVVPIEEVRLSGLLKETVNLHHPDEAQRADLTMLRAAARKWLDYTERWGRYSKENGESIRPILVVQVRDAKGATKPISQTPLPEVVRILRDELGGPADSWFAHAFQEGVDLSVGGTEVRYLPPSAIDNDPDVRVVLFKTSLNTGWDCPRAEVMMSFRSAREQVAITQLVGRMVRAPLAHRIDVDEALNTVTLYLPHYNRKAVDQVIEKLTKDVPATEFERGDLAGLVRAPKKDRLFDVLASLPSYVIPRRPNANQVRRLGRLATLLSTQGLLEEAPDEVQILLTDILLTEYRKRRRTAAFQEVVKDGGSIRVRVVSWEYNPDNLSEEFETIDISDEAVDELFRWADRQFSENLAKAYWKRRAERQRDHRRSKLEAYALAATGEVIEHLQGRAQEQTQRWLRDHGPALSRLTGAAAQALDEIRGLAPDPELIEERAYPPSIQVRTAEDVWEGHVYVDGHGEFPTKLTSWEEKTLYEELSTKSVVGWLRNPPNKRWSLCIPYEAAGGVTRGVYPDFIVLRKVRSDIVADIIDPHLPTLDDAWRKAKGMAQFTQRHGRSFGRIQLVRLIDDKVKRLDLQDEKLRQRVLGVDSNQYLTDIFGDV